MNKLRCSFFQGAADNMPRPWEGFWSQLLDYFKKNFAPRRGSRGDDAKKSLRAISGTRFKEGTRRAHENAVDIGLMFFDFDNAREEATGDYWPDPRTGEPTTRPKMKKVVIDTPVSFDEVQEALRAAQVASYSWTTWNNRPGWPKFRVAVPLSHPVPADLWVAATEWGLNRLAFEPFCRGLDMPVLRDIARLNFLPGAPDPGLIHRGETLGELLTIPLGSLAAVVVPALPVAPWQESIQIARKSAREAGDHWFSHYRVGGHPVDFKALDLASLMKERGVAVGRTQAYGGGKKCRCHCPFSHEHSGAVDDDCAVVILTPDHWPSFKCSHSHHRHLGLQDLIELFWGHP